MWGLALISIIRLASSPGRFGGSKAFGSGLEIMLYSQSRVAPPARSPARSQIEKASLLYVREPLPTHACIITTIQPAAANQRR